MSGSGVSNSAIVRRAAAVSPAVMRSRLLRRPERAWHQVRISKIEIIGIGG
jgi:hypothetical protein